MVIIIHADGYGHEKNYLQKFSKTDKNMKDISCLNFEMG